MPSQNDYNARYRYTQSDSQASPHLYTQDQKPFPKNVGITMLKKVFKQRVGITVGKKGRDHAKLNLHSPIPQPCGYVCLTTYLMASSLPFLHTVMSTPCLKTFWHSDPYICYTFGKCVIFWGSHIFSEDRLFHTATANRELR